MNIKELAEQAGLGTTSNSAWYPLPIGLIHLVRFAELIRQYEREACAKEAEHWQTISSEHKCGEYIASAIRARSSHE